MALSLVALVGVLALEAVVARRRDYPYQAFERIQYRSGGAGPPLRIAMLGDSTVAGVGVREIAQTLPAQVAERIARLTERAAEVTGYGVSGARTAEVLASAPDDLAEFDVLVVVIGSNDVTHLTPAWTFRRETAALLDALPRPVVLGGIPLFGGATALDRPLRDVVQGYAAVLRRIQRDVATEHPDVRFVDIAVEASPRFRGVPEAMSSDGFHPAAIGYGFWADALAVGVVEALGAVGNE